MPEIFYQTSRGKGKCFFNPTSSEFLLKDYGKDFPPSQS